MQAGIQALFIQSTAKGWGLGSKQNRPKPKKNKHPQHNNPSNQPTPIATTLKRGPRSWEERMEANSERPTNYNREKELISTTAWPPNPETSPEAKQKKNKYANILSQGERKNRKKSRFGKGDPR